MEVDSDTEDDLTISFNRAAKHATTIIHDFPPNKLLEIYAFYKQATTGDCTGAQPRFYEPKKRAKYDAWTKIKGMSSDDAKRNYIRIISEQDPNFTPVNPDNPDKSEFWVTVSSLLNTDAIIPETDKTIFDFCKENNLPQLQKHLEKNPEKLSIKDENGLGLVHWAADRGNLEILKYLIGQSADLNMVDDEGQTALHYASSCDYVACVEVLVNAGADCHLCDNDGLKPVDLTTNTEILDVLKRFM